MKNFAARVKEKLISLVDEMEKSSHLYVKNPAKDFTRNRKLTFKEMLLLLISMGGNSIRKELLDFSGYDINTATTSAFVQQRDKILPSALDFLFHEFTHSMDGKKTFNGYRLLAVDGSDLHTPTNSNDTETFFQTNDDSKGYNLLHLNALYDLCNKLYEDVRIQPRRSWNEHAALAAMVDCSHISGNVILLADRGYESYNNMAHIENKGWNYVIRIRNFHGIVSALKLPDKQQFDVTTEFILTRKQTKQVKAHPEIYKFLPINSHFDYIDLHTNKEYLLKFRVVRFKISEDTYETVITNLTPDEFPPESLKKIYQMRWGIETSFRELKYSIGLINFHAKKTDHIVQEIYARLIMYNFSMMITSNVVIKQKNTKLSYQANFTEAIHICRHFIRCSNMSPPDVEALIQKDILPVRPDRQDKRKIRFKSAVSFIYRIA